MSDYNSIKKQKTQWANAVRDAKEGEIYGYSYGDPLSPKAVTSSGELLGDYRKILDEYLVSNIDDDTVIMELGSLAGKWVQHVLMAGTVICVDLNTIGFAFIEENLPSDNIEFYQTQGYELDGIEDDSVDIIFSMDTLVRSEKGIFSDYMKEFKRVLREDGKLCLHFPCTSSKGSVARGFTPLTEEEIIDMCELNEFSDYEIDSETITHGIILKVGYGHKQVEDKD